MQQIELKDKPAEWQLEMNENSYGSHNKVNLHVCLLYNKHQQVIDMF